jgi:hypothetical protein
MIALDERTGEFLSDDLADSSALLDRTCEGCWQPWAAHAEAWDDEAGPVMACPTAGVRA